MFKLALLFGLALSGITACSTADNVTASHDINLVIEGNDELRFNPESVVVPAGANISLLFKNIGSLEHNFAIINDGVELFDVDESAVFQDINTGDMAGGESFRISFAAPDPGKYTYVCLIAGHAVSGMVGTLEVSAGSSN